MNNLIIADEIEMTATAVDKVLTRVFLERNKFYDKYYLVCDNSFVSEYLVQAMNIIAQKSKYFPGKAYFVPVGKKSDAVNEMLSAENCALGEVSLDELKNTVNRKKETSCVICFFNCDEKENKGTVLNSLDSIFSFAKNNSSRVVVGSLLPLMPLIPQGIDHLAEREFNFFVEEYAEEVKPEFEFYCSVEKRCRQAVRDENISVSLLRFDNVFAPDNQHMPAFDLKETIKDVFRKECVQITDEDYKVKFTLTYIRDVVSSLVYALYKVKAGHTYNVAVYTTSAADIKLAIHSKCSDVLKLNCDVKQLGENENRSLGGLKFRKTGYRPACNQITAVYSMICYLSEIEYDLGPLIAFYDGKLKRLKDLEIYILNEIERICKKYDIKYFLAGGSLLGAVRNGMSIVWDDDLDIGMLREDYNKFRKVFEKEMGEQFSYSSPFNKSGSHYTIDKVRLKGTYFSTNFSSKNVTEDGIFIDILVYDKTSNNKLLQKLHMAYLYAITKALEVRWYNEPRKNFHYRASKLALPFLRLIPYRVYHGMFELGVSFYKNKKNAKYLIDSVGKKLIDGVMPIDGLEEVQYVDFDGVKAPIPVDYTGYLNYAYGPNYMTLPTYSKRSAPHNFARIDMGEYIFENKEKAQFRDVNIKGELFEEEI